MVTLLQIISYGDSSPIRMAISELDSFVKGNKDRTELSAKEKASISKTIELAANEYKIHLMPKLEHMEKVVTRLITKIGENAEPKEYVAQYKVMLGEKKEVGSVTLSTEPDSHGGQYPRIVLYAESKEAGQAILDAVRELFPDAENLGDNILPRGNNRVNSLICYAHGSGGIKIAPKIVSSSVSL